MVSKIRALAYEKRMTIAAVERAAGISNGSISKWDKHAPKADSLRKVAEVLGTTSDFLLSDDELPPETKKAPVPEDEGEKEKLIRKVTAKLETYSDEQIQAFLDFLEMVDKR